MAEDRNVTVTESSQTEVGTGASACTVREPGGLERAAQIIDAHRHIATWPTARSDGKPGVVMVSVCLCDARSESHSTHVAAELAAAGIGSVADAYRHAADVVHAEARYQWEQDVRGVVGAQTVAQRMVVVEGCLRHFAGLAPRG